MSTSSTSVPSPISGVSSTLQPLHPYLRGAPLGLPFRFDVETVRRGLNFPLTTNAGPIDVLGEITGVGDYASVSAASEDVLLFGATYRCINLDALIVSKRAAGRTKDLEAVAELELIRDEKSSSTPSDSSAAQLLRPAAAARLRPPAGPAATTRTANGVTRSSPSRGPRKRQRRVAKTRSSRTCRPGKKDDVITSSLTASCARRNFLPSRL